MRIRKVESVKLSYREFYERDALAVVGGAEHPMDVLLTRIETDNGLVGYGESISYGGIEGVAAAVDKILSPLIVGEECNVLRLWDKMYKATFRLGRRGIMISGISGIDIALWDLLGKELGSPVYKLMGSPNRPIKGYITGGHYGETKDISKMVEEVRSYVNQGFDTVKIKVGGLPIHEDIKRISTLRKEFGENIDIAVDANNVYDFNTALRIGRQFEKLGVLFFEEPVPTDHPDLSAELSRILDLPIAGYETAYTLYEFRDLITKHAVDIVQVDAAWNGGITEMYRIGTLCRAYGLPLIPHYSAGGIGFIASLHTALAIDSPMIEYHLWPNPLREELIGKAISYDRGQFAAPTRPGLGFTFDERVLEKYKRE